MQSGIVISNILKKSATANPDISRAARCFIYRTIIYLAFGFAL